MALNLSDLELSQKLVVLGVDVGPITDTTREVYLRKYKSLISQPPASSYQPPKQTERPSSTPSEYQSHYSPEKDPKPARLPPQPLPPDPAPPPNDSSCLNTPQAAVIEQLLLSLENCNHVANDTAFLFSSGEVLFASRSVLVSQCNKMIPLLYNNDVPYPVKVVTLSGQTSEFMVRDEELVQDLKEKISMVVGIPISAQRLLFKQQELTDSSTVASFGLCSGASLHLVLVSSEMNSATVSYTSPKMSPTLSISHFSIGLSQEQCSYFTPTSPPQAHPTTLPSHVAHIVHVHDSCAGLYQAFGMFLRYLYCRKLQELDKSQCSSYLICYVLGELFQMPCLVQTCLSAISTCLTTGSIPLLLEFSRSIKSQPLEQLCLQFTNMSAHQPLLHNRV